MNNTLNEFYSEKQTERINKKKSMTATINNSEHSLGTF